MVNSDTLSSTKTKPPHASFITRRRNKIPQNAARLESFSRQYVESILRGLVRCPARVRMSVAVEQVYTCRKVRVDLRVFEQDDRARLVGAAGRTAASVRRLLRSSCALRRRWGCLSYINDDWVLSDEGLRRGLPPPLPLTAPPAPFDEDEDRVVLKEYLTQILCGLVRCPFRLSVSQQNGAFCVNLGCLAPDDRGRLVGVGGETSSAIRCVMRSACALQHVHFPVRFIGGDPSETDACEEEK